MKNNHVTACITGLLLLLSWANSLAHIHAAPKTVPIPITLQSLTVTGKVTDDMGRPIYGAHILIQGTQRGAFSGPTGSYTLEVTPSDILECSYLGHVTQTITVAGRTTIDFTLETETTLLEGVELNAGYYSVSQKERTGNIVKVNAKEIDKQPVSNPLATIQGRMSGVDISQNSGIPGGGYIIRIRGQNSINAGNDPLYIVDGVPFGSSSLGSAIVSGSIIPLGNPNPLSVLAPEEIQSIEVLKDADATAIYGSRGANGVVLITTKKGQVGKTRLSVDLTSGLGHIAKFPKLMDTPTYLEMRREAFTNDGFSDYPFYAYDINGTWDPDKYTDWQEELLGETAYRHSARLSFSGGNATTRFRMGAGHQQETTVFVGDSKYKKTDLQASVNHRSEDGKLGLDLSMGYGYEDNKLPGFDLSGQARNLPPNAPTLYDAEGALNWENGTWTNPLSLLESDYLSDRYSLLANLVLSYRPTPALEFKTNIGYNDMRLEESRTSPHTMFNPAFGLDSRSSSIFFNNGGVRSWIVEPQIGWEMTYGNLALKVLAGATFQGEVTTRLTQLGVGYSSNALLYDLSAASYHSVLSDTRTEYRYQALFGRINLSFGDIYHLNITGRRDGSSRFGPGRRFADFWALGGAWIFTRNRSIGEALPFLSFGKLRGSYGTTGNDQIGDYQYLDTYSVSGNNYNGITGLRPSRLFNPDFGWEENRKSELALELGFLRDRIYLTGSWYDNRSTNQLTGIPLPATTGFTSIQSNLAAKVANTGWEFELKTVNLDKENIRWTTRANLSIPNNELLEFPGLETSTLADTYVIGQPLSIKKLYHSQGVDPQTGYHNFLDYDDNGIIDVNDRQWIADTTPAFHGGLGNTLTLGPWEMDLFFQFRKQDGFGMQYGGIQPGSMVNQPIEVGDRWQEIGSNAPQQRYSAGFDPNASIAFDRYRNSSGTFTDTSFFRLRTVSVSYDIPSGSTMDCQVYLQGHNLWTWTALDNGTPEGISGFIPQPRMLTLGLRLGL
ncbi:SusC/RagA family TonB-linked outer membrane protein [Sediminicola luteus]|nr:SusC/RagA family TonB-linked outer membrane protein [Sediminicola luteus]